MVGVVSSRMMPFGLGQVIRRPMQRPGKRRYSVSRLPEHEVRKRLAQDVQRALHKHKVFAEELGDTASFLAQVLGAMISIFPVADRAAAIDDLRPGIERGIVMGVPEE